MRQLDQTVDAVSSISQDQELPVSLPDSIYHLLLECTSLGYSSHGRRLHFLATSHGIDTVGLLRDQFIRLFASCGSLEDANLVFLKAVNPSVHSWQAIISAHTANGQGELALSLFDNMQGNGVRPNRFVFMCMLKACGNMKDIGRGRLLHQQITDSHLDTDLAVGTSLIEMYVKCGQLEKAQEVFDGMLNRDVIIWNALLVAYEQCGHSLACLELYEKMQQEGLEPDKVTFFCMLKTCGSLGEVALGMQIHGQIIRSGLESDMAVGSTLVDMYGKCGNLEAAGKLFERLPKYDIVLWNVMINGCAQHGHGDLALQLFEEMQLRNMVPNKVTFLSILKACSSIGALDKGKLVHSQFLTSDLNSDVEVSNALIDMYAKCKDLQEARKVFDDMPNRDVVSFGAMIAGYVEHGHGLAALELFARMQEDGTRPDRFIFSSVVKACTVVGAIERGRLVHEQIKQNGFESDVYVGTSLVNMYAKCDSLEEAWSVFNRLPYRNLVSWSAIIAGCALHGEFRMAIRCLQDMVRQGLTPNDSIHAGVLTACSHAGQVDKGCWFFKRMQEDQVVTPTVELFNCMVDLFGRAGHLNEAKDLLETMPVRPDTTGWLSLLTACRAYSRFELGRQCFDQLVHLGASVATGYMLMSNIYSEACMWDKILEIQELRKSAGAKKQPGKSWVEINQKVHEFVVGDQTHPHSEKIYSKLKALRSKMEQQGYMPELSLSGHFATDVEKRDLLLGHSEKLAIAYGLLMTPEGATVRVTKNLKVCKDCHTASKLISKIERRQIILSDAYCIHRFEHGACSCGDFC